MTLRLNPEHIAPAVLVSVLIAIGVAGPLAGHEAVVIAVIALPLGAVLVWRVHPAWTLSLALCLSVIAGNWGELGIPGTLAPDRLLLVGGILAVVLRAPPIEDRRPLEFGAVHWVMTVCLAWMVGSALAAGTITDRSEQFELLERLGLLPFLLFLVAPVVFDTERHRRVLLGSLVALGGYLGFTALMETLKLKALVFPSFITDPSIGTHADRARGPFLEAVTNGAGLYAGLVAAGIALAAWSGRRSRQAAAATLILCAAGLFFTETRSVWLGGIAATGIALLAVRELRVWFVPAVGAGLAIIVLSLSVVPGLAGAVNERRNDDRTVWDRKNLLTAAGNAVEAHPLVGVGWGRFEAESGGYFWQNPDFPLTAKGTVIHNQYASYAAETGLVGVSLWLLALALGAAAALRPTGNAEARRWQMAFGAYLIFYLVISFFVYAQVFPNAMLWLLAGVTAGAASATPASRTL